MKRIGLMSEGWCSCCEADEAAILLDGLCADCYDGPLAGWMARLLFEEGAWTQPNAWREYLDAARARRGSEDGVTCWTLPGPMWARLVLEEVS